MSKSMSWPGRLKQAMGLVVLSLFLCMSLSSCASKQRQPVHVPDSLRAPVPAPEVPEGMSYAQQSGYILRALGALEEANKQNASVLAIVDDYNKK
ncbi:hypothetical protein ST21_008 [Aeromonas phage ST21]|nr:hypothetical protein ST21_008 [Aeromonas phage ST21]